MEELPGDEALVRHVLDIDSIEQDPEVRDAFRDLIGYLVARGTNISFESVSPEEVIDKIWELLQEKFVVLVCYTDPRDLLEWKFEPGPRINRTIPIDISLN